MNLKDHIRSIPDYPKKGILFRDITTLIKNEKAFTETINQIIERSKKYKIDKIAALDDKIDKMMKDRTDLVHGIQKLKGSINDLNQKGRERLLEAFEKVGRKFNDVYTKLFAGGSARLEMVESDDPLEAGLELLVSPPGKKLQSINIWCYDVETTHMHIQYIYMAIMFMNIC